MTTRICLLVDPRVMSGGYRNVISHRLPTLVLIYKKSLKIPQG